jgi:hypothetical protein
LDVHDFDIEDDEALAVLACEKDGNSSECVNSMRMMQQIRTATGTMDSTLRLCICQPVCVVLAELSVHVYLEPSRALTPRLS